MGERGEGDRGAVARGDRGVGRQMSEERMKQGEGEEGNRDAREENGELN